MKSQVLIWILITAGVVGLNAATRYSYSPPSDQKKPSDRDNHNPPHQGEGEPGEGRPPDLVFQGATNPGARQVKAQQQRFLLEVKVRPSPGLGARVQVFHRHGSELVDRGEFQVRPGEKAGHDVKQWLRLRNGRNQIEVSAVNKNKQAETRRLLLTVTYQSPEPTLPAPDIVFQEDRNPGPRTLKTEWPRFLLDARVLPTPGTGAVVKVFQRLGDRTRLLRTAEVLANEVKELSIREPLRLRKGHNEIEVVAINKSKNEETRKLFLDITYTFRPLKGDVLVLVLETAQLSKPERKGGGGDSVLAARLQEFSAMEDVTPRLLGGALYVVDRQGFARPWDSRQGLAAGPDAFGDTQVVAPFARAFTVINDFLERADNKAFHTILIWKSDANPDDDPDFKVKDFDRPKGPVNLFWIEPLDESEKLKELLGPRAITRLDKGRVKNSLTPALKVFLETINQP